MKNFAIKLVWFTTIYVFVFAGLYQTAFLLPIIMGMNVIGLFLIPFMVYTALTDDYQIPRTFKDWYGNFPVKTLDEVEK